MKWGICAVCGGVVDRESCDTIEDDDENFLCCKTCTKTLKEGGAISRPVKRDSSFVGSDM